jgi:UDP:flavonoid glycosyltransferase YjiC (YdhE family)
MTENGARVAWAGAGVMVPWRLVRPATLRVAVRRVLADPAYGERAREIAAWGREHDGPTRGAELVEELAGSRQR